MALLVLTATLPNRVAVVIFWNHRGLSGDSHIIWLFGGSCGLMPRRRRQPGSGATRSEPVSPTEREGPARGRRRHAVAAEALVPPAAGSSRRDSYRDSRRNSVHKCPETAPRGHFGRSVYTPASPRLSATAPQPNSVHECPKTTPRGHFGRSVYTPASPPHA